MRRLSLVAAAVLVAGSLGAIPGVAAPANPGGFFSGVASQGGAVAQHNHGGHDHEHGGHDHGGHDHGTEPVHEHAHHDHDHDHSDHDHAHDGHNYDGHHHEVDANEEMRLGKAAPKVTITEGHVDLGPRLVDGQWVLAARDDTAKTPVWRHPNDMAFVLGESAVLRVPDNADYQFLGVPAGTPVYTIGQNQVAGAPWLGWNTQAPELATSGVSGVKLRLTGHQGPGEVHVFLQSGNFGAPQVVWSTAGHKSTEIYIEANTHTHANWVFTQPGVHLLQFQVTGADASGREIAATAVLRFAVGKGATPEQALGETWKDSSSFEMAPHESGAVGAAGGTDTKTSATTGASETDATSGKPGERDAKPGLGLWLPLVGGILVVLIPAGAIVIVRRRIREREAVAKRYAARAGIVTDSGVEPGATGTNRVPGNDREGNHD